MSLIQLETIINAPIERCFDLSRSVELHIESTVKTNERAVAGVTAGMMKLGDIVTWQARHFGVVQKLTVKITKFNNPYSFQDSQLKGIFAWFRHDHIFESLEGRTLMKDSFEFQCPFGILGKLVEPIVTNHLTKFLKIRNQSIKEIAESEDKWKSFIF